MSPTVFNFFDASYARPGLISDAEMISPEFELLNDVTAATVTNYIYEGLRNGFHQPHLQNRFIQPLPGNPAQPLECRLPEFEGDLDSVLDHASLLLAATELTDASRAAIAEFVGGVTDVQERTLNAVFAVAISPSAAIQR